MNPRYSGVAERAGHRCEYCHAPEAIFNFPFEVEHIIPPGRAGSDDESNLALSCRGCNVFKADQVEALDAETGEIISLFHPRRHRWEEHFEVSPSSGTLNGLTPIGRATIALLRMNRPVQSIARRQWMRLKLFP